MKGWKFSQFVLLYLYSTFHFANLTCTRNSWCEVCQTSKFYYFKCLSLQWMHLRSSFVSKKHVALLAGTNCAYPSTKLFFNFCHGSLPPKSLKVFQWVNKNDKKSWSKRMQIEISFILWLSYGLILEVNKYFYL